MSLVKLSRGAAILLGTLFLGQCATKGGDDKKPQPVAQAREEADDGLFVSGRTTTLTHSLSNNGLVGHVVDPAKARALASKLAGELRNPGQKDRAELIALMASKRLSGEAFASVVATARELMKLQFQKNVELDLPSQASLELALSALQKKQYNMALFQARELIENKNPKIRAAAHTIRGIVHVEDDRLPEAIFAFREALKADSGFEAARLNIGFYAAKYADPKMANSILSGVRQDWAVKSVLAYAARIDGKGERAKDLCSEVLAARPNYKPALFNCALNHFQNLGNKEEALNMLRKMTSTTNGPNSYDDEARKWIGRIAASGGKK